MTQKLYTEAYIQDIANAIRALNKKTEKYKVSQMAATITSDLGGGVDATDLNVQTVVYSTSNLEVI